jgi:acyl-CoA dehydrogenase
MIPRHIFNEDHDMLRESVRAFLAQEAAPYHAQWEKDGHVDRELWIKAGEMGFLCPNVPEEYGGPGLDFLFNMVVTEEISHANLSGIGWGLHSDIAVPYITNYGTEEQKQTFLPGCVSGEYITAIAMSEPAAGSDLQGVKTTAVRDGDGWVMNGSKTFITNGQLANLIIVVAKTDPSAGAKGTSLFLVDTDKTPGFERGRNLEKIGMKAQDTSELFFNDAKLPADALLGGEGQGFGYLMDELPQERLSVAANAVANSAAALEWTREYVTDRKAFGKPISAFQNTQFVMADLATEIAVTRAFVDRCAELHVTGDLDTATASMAKLKATELQCRVLDDCVQLHGGYGYMWEYPVARAWADARVQRIYAGTSEVMKMIIARSLFGGGR